VVRTVAAVVESCWHRVPGGTAAAAVRSLRAVQDLGDYRIRGLAAWHRHGPVLDELDGLEVVHLPLGRRLLYETWHDLRRPRFASKIGPVDLVHATGGVVPPAGGVPLVVTLYDLVFLDHPEFFTRQGVRFMTRGFQIARTEADLIVVPSQATAEACRHAGIEPERIRVVPLGATPVPCSAQALAAVRDRYQLPDVFALWVGTTEPRKNLDRLVEAHRRACPNLPLLLVGPNGWKTDTGALHPGASKTGASPAVRHLGRLPAADLAAVYELATALVYPSLLEGFGMPVLEAMAQGTAAITSIGTSTEEVAGDVGRLVDPTDVDALGEALASVADNPGFWTASGPAARARAATMTWAATGRGLQRVYDEVLT
jgi:glycosyltransferase involved in cell wall biosynthesis